MPIHSCIGNKDLHTRVSMWVRKWLLTNCLQNHPNNLYTIVSEAVIVAYRQNFFIGEFFDASVC